MKSTKAILLLMFSLTLFTGILTAQTATLSFGNLDEGAGTVEILMDADQPVAGFQFSISGMNITGASGGSAAAYGMFVSTSGTTLLGFSLTGASIPAGSDILTIVSFDSLTDTEQCLSEPVISGVGGVPFTVDLGPCLGGSSDIPGCTDEMACNYDPEATVDDGSCEYFVDCEGVCGGSAFIDDCGVCSGGTTGHEANSDMDDCGVCFGSNDCFGCTDPSATNYDPDATIDDGSCMYDDQIVNLYIGAVDEGAGTMEIWMNNPGPAPCGGFQFDITGLNILSATGGSAMANGFMVSASGTTVIGFSLTGATIPVGDEVLTIVSFDSPGSEACISNGVISGPPDVGGLLVTVGDCYEFDVIIYGCTDEEACNYNPDATMDDGSCEYFVDCEGVCGGSAFIDDCGVCSGGTTGHEANSDMDDCGVCFGNNEDMDCNGDCFGEAFVNECGCVGGNTGLAEDFCYGCTDPEALNYDPNAFIDDGSCEYPQEQIVNLYIGAVDQGAGTMEIWMNNPGPAPCGGFQFDITGLNILSATGGSAMANGFMVSASGTTVIGFSLTGATIPVGDEVLTIVSFDSPGSEACISNGVISGPPDVGGLLVTVGDCYEFDVIIYGCTDEEACNYNPDATMDDGSCEYFVDCEGVCGGSAFIDDCGVCSGGTTGHEANSDMDECGVCFGNNEDMDCNGDCFGEAFVNECGCVGGNTGLAEDFCYGCTDPEALNYDPNAFIDDGSCEYPQEQIVNLYIGAVDQGAGTMEIWMNNPGPAPCGGFQFDITGLNILSATGGSAMANGFMVSASGTTVIGFSLTGATIPVGDEVLTIVSFDSPGSEACISNGVISGPPDVGGLLVTVGDCYEFDVIIYGCTDEEACNYNPDATMDDGSCEYFVDCEGVCGGSAFIDDCGVCSGGTTGHEANSDIDECGVCFGNNEDMDCNGDCFGEAFVNECGCVGGNTGLAEDFCYGCTDPEALNYDPNAFIDDGSCEYPQEQIVNLYIGAVDQGAGTMEIWMNNPGPAPCGGFQFDITGLNILSATGGSAMANGFMVSASGTTVIGFSLTGATIPVGDEVLTIVSFDSPGSEACISNGVISGPPDVGGLLVTVGDCYEFDVIIYGCTDEEACNYNPDATMDDGSCEYFVDCEGVCGGSAFIDDCGVCSGGTTGHEANSDIDECGVCFGNNEDMDCNGDCFGEAFVNECGCVGGNTGLAEDFCYGCTDPEALNYDPNAFIDDGSCEYPQEQIVNLYIGAVDQGAGTMEIWMNNPGPAPCGGFQFDITGLNILSATGGSAMANGFMVSASGTTVIGFSLTGATIPVGDEVLTIVSFDSPGSEACISNGVISGPPDVGGLLVTVGDCYEFDVIIYGCTDEEACNYNPDATMDDGSCEYFVDCEGVCGGSAFIDDCGVCSGGTTGHEANSDIDDCGVCFGNNEDMDCNGDCFGEAFVNECGCVGGNTGLAEDFCYGCTDPEALNYDPNAFIDDGSCEYPQEQIVNLYIGAVDQGAGTMEIWMNNPGPAPCGGFQFDITGLNILSATGGSAMANGFMVSASGTTVIGFSLTGATIPVGDEVLTIVSFDSPGSEACISNGVISGPPDVGGLLVTVGDCYEFDVIIYGCTDEEACNYNPDATMDDGSCEYFVDCEGVCGGSAFIDDCGVCSGGTTGHEANSDIDECGVCFGNNEDMDCNGDCFGEAFVNECGCVGGNTGLAEDFCYGCTDPEALNYDPNAFIDDGSCEYPQEQIVNLYIGAVDQGAGTMEIWMNNPGPAPCGGFQFDITGLNILSATGGSAMANGFMVSASGTTVIGFSLTGATIPVGDEVLTIVSFDSPGSEACISNGVISGPPDVGGLLVTVGDCYEFDVIIYGCTDEEACNYNPDATMDDGSCEYFVDCEGVCGGSAFIDDCGVCSGGTTGHEANSDIDECGVCFGNNEDMDCNGDCFGEAFIDNCGICSGGNTGHEADSDIDDCGVCFGNNEDMDCNGDCFGDAFINDCGCVGGNTGLDPDYCFGCTDPEALNYDPDAFIDDGSCEYPPQIVELDFGYYDQFTGFMEIVYNNPGPAAIGGFQFDITGINIVSVSGGMAAEYGFMTSASGSTVIGFSLSGATIPVGTGVLTDVYFTDPGEFACFDNAIISGPADVGELGVVTGDCIPFEVIIYGCTDDMACNYDPEATDDDGSCIYPEGCNDWCPGDPGQPEIEDCWGECGGTAFIDDCGECVGGSTGMEENWAMDCNGDCFGDAFVNDCGCVGGNTGLDPEYCYGCTDPEASNYDPEAFIDDGSCYYMPDEFAFNQSTQQAFYFVFNATIADIELESTDWIGAFKDDICVGATVYDVSGNTTVPAMGDSGAEETEGYMLTGDIPEFVIYDASEDAFYDAQVVPLGDLTWSNLALLNIELLFVEMDCAGVVGGSAFLDDCGQCVGGTTGAEENWAMDCAGDCFGGAVIDDCGECVLGSTGLAYNYAQDDCGVCFGNNEDMDCYGECFGTAFIDACGECVGGSTGMEELWAMDCAGVCFGEAYMNECGCVGGTTGLEADFCYGCTNPDAVNYDPEATIDDGSCILTITQTLDLHDGANLVSFYISFDDPNIATVFADLAGDLTGIIGEGVAAQPHPLFPDQWIGSLSEIELTSGYWLTMDVDRMLESEGYPIDPGLVYDLHSGANLMSYIFAESQGLTDAVPTEIMDHFTGWIGEGLAAQPHPLFPGQWIGSLTQFEGGAGYWGMTDQDMAFNWNDPALSRSTGMMEEPAVPAELDYIQSTGQAFYFIGSVDADGFEPTSQDWLVAFNNGIIVGARQWNGEYTDIPAMGSDGTLRTSGYLHEGDVPQFKLYNSVTGELTDLQGDVPAWSDNTIFNVTSLEAVPAIPEGFVLYNAYPNPFNPSTSISYSISVPADVQVGVFDMLGRQVAELVNEHQESGLYQVDWNAGDMASGIYFVKFVSGNTVKTQKLMLVK